MSDLTSYPKDKIKILLLENISDKAVEKFTDNGYTDVTKLSKALSEDELIEAIKDVHLLGIRSKTQVTRKVMEAANKLQGIGCFCIGTNQVDLDAATDLGIAVFNAPYSNTRSVAELVIGTSIMLIRKIFEKNEAAHKGGWIKSATGSHEIRGKVMGIIGYGNIGSQLSVLAESMGMKVYFYDPEIKLPLGNATACKTMKEVLEKSDIVSLHVPQLESTKNLINKDNINFFKEGAILINDSRGTVVDIDVLKEALVSGKLSGAAVDVFPLEPKKNGDAFTSPLQGLKNVLLTPHIGGSTEEAQVNIGIDVSNKLFNYLEAGITDGSLTVPALGLPSHPKAHRILHIHENIPGVLSAINGQLLGHNINILSQYLKTNDKIGYVVLDVDNKLSEQAFQLLKTIKGTIKIRKLY